MEDIEAQLEKACQSLSKQHGEEFAAEIRQILFANLDRGRVHEFIQDEKNRVYEYVERVVQKYCELHLFIKKIQIERAEESWGPLLERMQGWSYNFFVKKGFYADESTREIAGECAHEAALMLLNSHFPYDVDFEPWAHVIVQNACRRYVRKSSQKKNIPAKEMITLDNLLEEVEDPRIENIEQSHEHDDLLDALALLSDARRQAIELLYFEELSPKEAAEKMGKSVGAMYGLQFHAFEDLRKILDKKRNNTYE